jgi:death-on-curing protein
LPSEPIWLALERVIYINKRLVGLTGEPHFLRDSAMLESAIYGPRNHWFFGQVTDMAVLAGALLLAINRNHPFEQGNKRTALAATEQFLRANGYVLIAPDSIELGEFILRSAAGTISQSVFDYAFRKCIITVEEWQEFKRQLN